MSYTVDFKTETLNLAAINVYQPLDRINLSARVHPNFPRDLSVVKDHLFSNIWAKPNFTLGFNLSLKLKGVRIYDSLCTSTGVRTYFYKMVGSEFAFMYQKRPLPQKDFIVIFPNITHMFNDAIGSDRVNENVFADQNFNLASGVSRHTLQACILAYAKKSKRALSLSETTRGIFGGPDAKYNIFIRNYPKLDMNGKAVKCKKKIIVLKGEDAKTGTKVAFYSGNCFAPVEVKHHQCMELTSDDEQLKVTFDIFVLYSVDQDMYTVYKPNGLRSFDFNHNGYFEGLFITKEDALTEVTKVIDLEQSALDSKARSDRLQKEKESRVA